MSGLTPSIFGACGLATNAFYDKEEMLMDEWDCALLASVRSGGASSAEMTLDDDQTTRVLMIPSAQAEAAQHVLRQILMNCDYERPLRMMTV